MAKVKAPLMSSEARGALGGIEFRLTRSGAVVGRRSIATPRRSTAAQAHTYWLRRARDRWAQFTPAQKSRWAGIWPGLKSPFSSFQVAAARDGLRNHWFGLTNPRETRDGRIYNLAIGGQIGNDYRAWLGWAHRGTTYNLVYVYLAQSYAPHASPPLDAFRFVGWSTTHVLSTTFPRDPFLPDSWYRVEVVNPSSMRTLQTEFIHTSTPWL